MKCSVLFLTMRGPEVTNEMFCTCILFLTKWDPEVTNEMVCSISHHGNRQCEPVIG